MPLSNIPETDEVKDQSTFTTEVVIDKEQLNAIKLMEHLGELKSKRLVNKMGNQVQLHTRNKQKRKFYMEQLQRLYNAFGIVFKKCPFNVAKIKKKD